MGGTIFTIGHGNRTLDELLEAVRAHAVTQLVDVRSFPGSRRNPQFGRQELERSLPANRIAYLWMKDLGGRRRSRPDSPHTAWHVEGFRAYTDYMDTPAFGPRSMNCCNSHARLPPRTCAPSGFSDNVIAG